MKRRTTAAFAGASALLDRGIRDQLRLSWRLLRDERVSAFKFALPALLALYLMSPIDLIPDFLLGLGQMDDLGVVIAGSAAHRAKPSPGWRPGMSSTNICGTWDWAAEWRSQVPGLKRSSTPGSTFAVSSKFREFIERQRVKAASHLGTNQAATQGRTARGSARSYPASRDASAMRPPGEELVVAAPTSHPPEPGNARLPRMLS